MAPRTAGCDRSFPQTSGSGDRTKMSTQPPNPNGTSKGVGRKENQSLKTGTGSASPQGALSGSANSVDKAARWARYQDRYHAFCAEADKRCLKRKDLEARNKMWQKERAKSQARIDAIEQEREQLLRKIEGMDGAKDEHNAATAVRVSAETDEETKGKWDAFLRMETDELDV